MEILDEKLFFEPQLIPHWEIQPMTMLGVRDETVIDTDILLWGIRVWEKGRHSKLRNYGTPVQFKRASREVWALWKLRGSYTSCKVGLGELSGNGDQPTPRDKQQLSRQVRGECCGSSLQKDPSDLHFLHLYPYIILGKSASGNLLSLGLQAGYDIQSAFMWVLGCQILVLLFAWQMLEPLINLPNLFAVLIEKVCIPFVILPYMTNTKVHKFLCIH